MSTLKVNKLRDTAGSADAITLDPNGGAVLAGVTTISTARVTSGIVTNTFIVGAGVTISESGIEASGIGITCANINGAQIGGRKNLVINGAMMVAQRAITTTTSGGVNAIDRMQGNHGGTDEAPTFAQVDVASGTTPYTEGFRRAAKFTNGNQTSGAGGGDYVHLKYVLEAQDIANSGWNFTSSSSFITLSFWVKSSVAQAFSATFRSEDGTRQVYNMTIDSLTADTWTKITKTIPGNSNLQFDNNVNAGLTLFINAFSGTTNTTTDLAQNTWSEWGSAKYSADMTSTWYTTNDATFEFTGIQLEVGSQATPFEHRSMGEELTLCQRYYFKLGKQDYLGTHMAAGEQYCIGMSDNDNVNIYGMINFPVRMRQPPTAIDQSGSAGDYRVRRDTSKTCTGVPTFVDAAEHYCRVNFPSSSHGWGTGQMLWCQSAGSSGYLGFSAEI